MEAVDGGDVGEDPCNDLLRDCSLGELSAKYLQRKRLYIKTHAALKKIVQRRCVQGADKLSMQLFHLI